jgi:hypothetical protein
MMLQSHVIEIDGRFVGAAVRQAGGYRLVAVDLRLEDLDGSVWPSLADVHRVARQALLTLRGAFPCPGSFGAAA